MRILDRLPIYVEPKLISVQKDVVQVWRNQIIVWISINDLSRPFPAILDTGHSHNFAISRNHLARWSGTSLSQIGESKVDGEIVPQFNAEIRIHRNITKRHELRGDWYLLEMAQGISVMPDESSLAPRLPLLGLKTILSNHLKLVIDGKRNQVSLSSSTW
jgi:hypothetical protein